MDDARYSREKRSGFVVLGRWSIGVALALPVDDFHRLVAENMGELVAEKIVLLSSLPRPP